MAGYMELRGGSVSGGAGDSMTASIGRPTDAALWQSVAATLRTVVLPDVQDPFARNAVVQLIGLAHYALGRGGDPSADRVEAIAVAMDSLVANPLVSGCWPVPGSRSAATVMGVASTVLAEAVGRHDANSDAIRAALRPLLIADLDKDLVGTAMLLNAFRGRLPDA